MLKSKRFQLKVIIRELSSVRGKRTDDDFLVENVWISTFYQTFSLFNHILSIFATFKTFSYILHGHFEMSHHGGGRGENGRGI